jgi:hypothetical protein
MMNHRRGRRLRVRLPVLIGSREGGEAPGIATDVGPEGMFVRMASSPGENACVTVRIQVSARGGPEPVTTRAQVVHRSAEGVGLLFCELDGRLSGLLERLLIRADPPEPSARARIQRVLRGLDACNAGDLARTSRGTKA